ncbi:MAG: short-chain dehydrogenase/reductase [Pseudonocardiales bacterium]|nr:short-chain dehydrogenase/reductase [Pseudonocardiales bacterium]
MSDRYQAFVSHGFGRTLSTKLGLPRPAILRRYDPAAPLLPGPALIVTLGKSPTGRAVRKAITDAGAEVADATMNRYNAIVIDATGADRLADLASLPKKMSDALKQLRPSGRVVVLGTPPGDLDEPETAAARQALDGLTRSLGKELRAGSTANLVLLSAETAPDALESTFRFFLSGRSAYVDGQVIRLDQVPVTSPSDWTQPLAGKIALVTGAARGIGAAIAQTLARDGATVICADLPGAGEALAGVANRIGGTTLQVDISAADAPARIADHLRDRFGGVDIVVHNAGITRDRLLANMKPEVWESVVDINLGAQLRINAALVDLLRPDARIVCLSSTSGIAGNRGQTNYAASKAGIIGMVRASAPALAANGSTINAVAPGFIDTEMTARMPFATREVARRLNSLQQAGLPIDVAEAVAWLASPGAGAVTGQVLRVCGQNLVGA